MRTFSVPLRNVSLGIHQFIVNRHLQVMNWRLWWLFWKVALKKKAIGLLAKKIFFQLKLMIHSILHYLWSEDLSKSFSELIMSILIFSQYFLNTFCPVEKCGVTPHCLYCDSLTLSVIFWSFYSNPSSPEKKKHIPLHSRWITFIITFITSNLPFFKSWKN